MAGSAPGAGPDARPDAGPGAGPDAAPGAAAPPGCSPAQIASLAARTYVRYAIPLTVLAAVALAPWLLLALRVNPASAPGASSALRVAWLLGATVWIGQLWLVGGAAPLARAIDAGAPVSQLRALGGGAVQLARALIPCLAATAAIAIGGLALAIPGLALLCLLSLSAAGAERALPGPLVESAEIVRRHLRLVIGTIAAMLVLDLAIVYLSRSLVVPSGVKKLGPVHFAMYRQHVQIVAGALVVITPWIAALLAALHTRARRA